MKRIFIILLSVLSLTAFAQQKKVAVYVTGPNDGINQVLGDQLVAAFAKSGKYIAIERTASFLAELGREHNYQRTGAVADSDISRLGKQFGVQLVCVTKISDVFGQKYVSARLIDVESAEVINTSNANSSLANMQELLRVTENITSELVSQTVQEKAVEIAAKQKEHAEREAKLKEQIEQGYIQVGKLYTTISYSSVFWSLGSIKSIARKCRIGGMSGWRIPTITEFNMVIGGIRKYQEEANFYPNIEKQLKGIQTVLPFWTSDGSWGYYGKERRNYDEQSYLMLVHDVQ